MSKNNFMMKYFIEILYIPFIDYWILFVFTIKLVAGEFEVTCLSQSIRTFIYLLGALILVPWLLELNAPELNMLFVLQSAIFPFKPKKLSSCHLALFKINKNMLF